MRIESSRNVENEIKSDIEKNRCHCVACKRRSTCLLSAKRQNWEKGKIVSGHVKDLKGTGIFIYEDKDTM